MKLFISFLLLMSFNLKAEIGRAPAVVNEVCDLDISTTKVRDTKIFEDVYTHQVFIPSDNNSGCSTLPKKRYPDSTFEEFARQEMSILFKKYPKNYSQKCSAHFKNSGAKDSEYACEDIAIESITFKDYSCDKKIEDGTKKVSFSGSAYAVIKYKQIGKRLEEKEASVVQKEQCTRVNECMGQARDEDMPALKKLEAVACKGELAPVETARAPALEKNSSFDGNRNNRSSSESTPSTQPTNETSGK